MNQYNDEEEQNIRSVFELLNLEFLWNIYEEMVSDIIR